MSQEDRSEAGAQRKPRVRHVAIVLILLAVLAAGAVGMRLAVLPKSARSDLGAAETYTVALQDYTFSVNESGTLRAEKVDKIASKVKNRVSILSIVPEGTTITEEDVRAGKVLVKLDAGALADSLTRQQISVENAAASLTKARENLAIILKENEGKINDAERELRFARMEVQEYLGDELAADTELMAQYGKLADVETLGGAALKERRMLESDVELAGEEVERAIDKATWTKRLFEKEYVTRNELKADELAVAAKRADLEQAQLAKDLLLRYELPREAETRVAAVQAKGLGLATVLSRARSEETQARASLKSAEATYGLETATLQKLQDQVENCTIRAQKPGLVVYATSAGSRRGTPIDEGVQVNELQEIIHLPDLSAMVADVSVPEAIVKRVQKGQQAVVTAEALPDKRFTGTVDSVSALPLQQNWWSNVKVFNAVVRIDGTQPELRPGMSCTAEISIATVEDAICVPIQAVGVRAGKRVCYVVTPEGQEARPVETGYLDHRLVQITGGLREGERIMLSPPLMAGATGQEEYGKDEGVKADTEVAGGGPAEETPAAAAPAAAPQAETRQADGGQEADRSAVMRKLQAAGITREKMARWRTEGIPAEDMKTLKDVGVPQAMIDRFTSGGGAARKTE